MILLFVLFYSMNIFWQIYDQIWVLESCSGSCVPVYCSGGVSNLRWTSTAVEVNGSAVLTPSGCDFWTSDISFG